MHDRYMYPSLLLFSIASGFNKKFLLPTIVLSLLNLINLYIVWHPVMIPFIPYSFINNRSVQWYISVCTVMVGISLYWKGYKALSYQ